MLTAGTPVCSLLRGPLPGQPEHSFPVVSAQAKKLHRAIWLSRVKLWMAPGEALRRLLPAVPPLPAR
jgi:hypothetical protein